MSTSSRRSGPLLLGEGALCSVLLKKLHPADRIAHYFPNRTANQRLADLVAVRKDVGRRASGRSVNRAIFFTSPSLGDEEVWAPQHFVKVVTSCPADKVFATPSPTATPATVSATSTPVVHENVTRTNDLDEDIARFRALDIHVDDDREPAPENVPAATATTETHRDLNSDLYRGQTWG